jgi:hypothetical protein
MRSLADGYKRALPITVWTTFVLAFAWSFGRAWTHTDSDFPSYYAAARLVIRGEPLHGLYNMAHFQQRMDSLVIPNRLGGYIPQTPLTMLPFVPFANLEMQKAKQVWLIADLAFLSGTVWLLTQITTLPIWEVLGLFVLGFGSLHTNLMLGQYYLLILFLLTAAIYLLNSGRDFFAGALLGLICSLKLITAPFLLYFVLKKQPKAIAGMCVALALSIGVAISLFGSTELAFYAGQILPRSLAGETLDPFNPANDTFTTLLRRVFVGDPELNPNAVLNLPPLFFFIRPLLELSILWISLLAFTRTKHASLGYAGYLVTLILISPNTASYTFLLLLLPTALLLQSASCRQKLPVVMCYVLLTIPNYHSWTWLFPKVWVLAAMFALTLVISGNVPRARPLIGGLAAAAAVSLLIAVLDTTVHAKEAHQRWKRIAVERGAIYSSSPIPLQDGVVYQSIRNGHYTLRFRSATQRQDFDLGGNAFQLTYLPRRGFVRFQSVRGGIDREFLLDPRTGVSVPASRSNLTEAPNPSRSPDGKWILCERNSFSSKQLYLLDRTQKTEPIQVTEGPCNSFAPAWELDSTAIVFASDCGRGVGMPALYRAPLQDMLALAYK